MIDLAEIERLEFTSSDALSRLDSLLGEVAGYAETRTAFEVVRILEEKLKTNPALAPSIDPYIVKFGTLALPLLPEKHVSVIMQHMTGVLSDERISLYERLRARLMVLPESQRSAFVGALLVTMRSSTEPFGSVPVQIAGNYVQPTVGAWVAAIESQGMKDPDALLALPELKALDEALHHAVRHLAHIVVLLADPRSSSPTIADRPLKQAPPASPSPPVNLPVAPAARPAPMPVTPAPPVPKPMPMSMPMPPSPPMAVPMGSPAPVIPPAPASFRPSMPAPATPQQAAPVPMKPPVPVAPPSQLPPAPPMTDRGPTVAAVVEKLKQTQLDRIVAPPTVAHLTSEDHAEIQKHADNLTSIDAGPNVHDTVSDTVGTIGKEFGVAFPDEHLAKRFSSIVTAQLKDIRNPSDTLDLLTRGVKVGGLGLDPELAEKIVMKAGDEASKFTTEAGVKTLIEQQKTVAVLPKPPKVPAELRPTAPPPPQPPPAPVKPVVQAASPAMQRPAAVNVPVQVVRPIPTAAPSMPTASFRPAATDRPTIADIKGSSRLVGPVEELRAMTLTDYRRLAPDPLGCIRRLYEKIQQLGKESFSRCAEGIKAWRGSETYRLYVAMGQDSLLSAKTIPALIAERQGSGQPALTEQEYSYISDLNRKLRS